MSPQLRAIIPPGTFGFNLNRLDGNRRRGNVQRLPQSRQKQPETVAPTSDQGASTGAPTSALYPCTQPSSSRDWMGDPLDLVFAMC